MSDPQTRLTLNDLSGGRNQAASPVGPRFEATQVVDAVNVDWFRTSGVRKRWGSSLVDMTGSVLTWAVSWLGRHVPGTDEADAELWCLDGQNPTARFQRLDNSTTWTAPAALIDRPRFPQHWAVTSCSLNGFFFISFPNFEGQDRLHVYDPRFNVIRRTGIHPGYDPPTVINIGAGSYPAVQRFYRVRWLAFTASNTIQRRSEPTPSVAFTPSGTGSAIRVTRPAVPANEYIEGWELELSVDNVTFVQYYAYERGNVLNPATTFVDIATFPGPDVAFLTSLNLVSAMTGTHLVQKSYRLIACDQNRLIGWGSWISSDKQHRLELSAIIGSLDKGDAERVDGTTNYFIDFDELDSGPPTALIGPVWGRFYAFKTRQMYELIPTGSIDQPYRRVKISGELGCVGSHCACRGEDAAGNPCLYILTHRGVYRYGLQGFEYIGKGIEDLVLGPVSRMNVAADVVGHMVFYPDVNQVWVWFATGTSLDPTRCCVFDVVANNGRGAWSRVESEALTHARCSVMFANSIGSVMGFPLVPYIGDMAALNRITKAADSAMTTDYGTPFQASVTTRPLTVPGFRLTTGDVQVLAPAAPGVTLTCTVVPDFGASPTVTGIATLTPTGTESRVTRPFSGSSLSGCEYTQLTIGDAAPVANAWSLDHVIIPIQSQEPITG